MKHAAIFLLALILISSQSFAAKSDKDKPRRHDTVQHLTCSTEDGVLKCVAGGKSDAGQKKEEEKPKKPEDPFKNRPFKDVTFQCEFGDIRGFDATGGGSLVIDRTYYNMASAGKRTEYSGNQKKLPQGFRGFHLQSYTDKYGTHNAKGAGIDIVDAFSSYKFSYEHDPISHTMADVTVYYMFKFSYICSTATVRFYF